METDSIFQLLKLSAEKQIPYTQTQLKKMSPDLLLKVYNKFKAKELDSFNEYLTEVAIIKFEEIMKKFLLVKQDSELSKKLQDKTLFKKDVKVFISYLSPLLPFVGLFEGAFVVAGEMIDKWGEENKTERENKTKDKHDDSSSQTEERGEQN